MNKLTTIIASGLIAIFAAACQEAAPTNPTSLRDITVPAGFDFATSRAVGLTVSATEEKLGAAQGLVEVALPSGEVLHRGPINAGTPLALNLAVPTKDADVLVKVSAGEKQLSGSAAIAGDGSAAFDVR